MSQETLSVELSSEDKKLLTLARATRARVGATEGAAVRDLDGRTYAAASVDLDSLKVTALQVCVAMAFASGSKGLEAAVRLSDTAEVTAEVMDDDLAVLVEFGGDAVLLHLVDGRGVVQASRVAQR